MKTSIARAAVISALLAAGAARAETWESYRPKQSLYIFNYEISNTLGSFHDDFISSTSWRGFSFEGRSMLNDRLSAGLGLTFNRFEQTHSLLSTTTAGGGTLSGPVYRYADQFGVKALFHAYFGQGAFRPYAGIGLGGVWSYAYAQTADFARADDGFDFIASPEAGFIFSAAQGASTIGLNFAVRYNFTTADFHSVTDAQSLAVVIGIFGGY
jgi:hypothetical protein